MHCTAQKKDFLFLNILKRWFFQKNHTGIWSFLHNHERYLFFPKIWPYSLDGKWKMIFLKKKYMKIYFLQMFWKDSFSKKPELEYDHSSIIRKDDISIPRIYDLILYLLTSNLYVQIFLYYCKLRFLQIIFAQVCAPQNAGDSVNTLLTRATKNIIKWFISFLERAKNIFRLIFTENDSGFLTQQFFGPANFNLTRSFWPLAYYTFWKIPNHNLFGCPPPFIQHKRVLLQSNFSLQK